MNAMMTSSATLPRRSFSISGTPDDNRTVRVTLAGAGAAAAALAGAGLAFCASKTAVVWRHNPMTTKAIINLKDIRLFIN